MAEHNLKILLWLHREIFEVCLASFIIMLESFYFLDKWYLCI